MSLSKFIRCRKIPPSQETPDQRYCFTFETLDTGEILMFGGGNFTCRVYNDAYVLDPVTFEWHEKITSGEKPRPRRSHASCLCRDPKTGVQLLAIFGGCNYSWHPVHDPFIYFLDTKRWKWIKGECDPNSRNHFTSFDLELSYSNSLLFFNNPSRLILYGGFNGLHQCDLEFKSEDRIICSWKKIKVSGKFVNNQYHAAVATGDYMYIFGGRYNPDFNIYCYNTRNEYMSEIFAGGSVPEYRSFLSARLLTDNLVIIFGGSEMEIKDDMFIYNIEENRFLPVIVDPLPRTVFGHSAAFQNYKMITFGGTYDSSGTEGCSSDIWIFDGFAKFVSPMKKDIPRIFNEPAEHTLNNV
eukprot:gb/GECH01013744.1/.p1 GENE.gb/GECH01013744.1/~~gb/GECH01013744.1/.p1  ORF type:complete len:354 (+),score=77.88 gb/GECH01013744.1/:1-1062(+)